MSHIWGRRYQSGNLFCINKRYSLHSIGFVVMYALKVKTGKDQDRIYMYCKGDMQGMGFS